MQYGSQQPHMVTEQLKCGYQIGQYRSRVHLYANKDNPIERKKFTMRARDGFLRSQESQSTRRGIYKGYDMNEARHEIKLTSGNQQDLKSECLKPAWNLKHATKLQKAIKAKQEGKGR